MLPKIFGIAAIIQIVMSIILIKYFGLMGAIISMILIKPVQILLTFWQTKKFFTFSYSANKMIFMPMIYFVIFVGFEIITFKYNHMVLYWIELALSGLLVLFFFRNEIRTLAADTAGKFGLTKRK
jgi:O-antigen/teichoic acid export membrane protein